MASDITTIRLTDDRETLEDKIRGHNALADVLPPENYRSALYDLALTHLHESLLNLEREREKEELPGRDIQRFNTSVLKYHYRTSINVERP